ncbi:hypothetical protein WAI453_008862 [Rhynchosporium graminicola]
MEVGVDLELEVDRDYEYIVSESIRTGHSITDVCSYTDHNGRTYNGWMAGAYSLPNDGEEQDRQDFIHHIYRLILDSRLGLAPIVYPRYVLDIATGTGIWAIEFAKEHPDTLVYGTDLRFTALPICLFKDPFLASAFFRGELSLKPPQSLASRVYIQMTAEHPGHNSIDCLLAWDIVRPYKGVVDICEYGK